jgi:hypothetical protein
VRRGARIWRLAVAGALGAGAALLVACGASGKNLIPVADAGPLQSDFNAISTAVANGDCAGVDQALAKARADLTTKLPSTVDPRLRARLQQGLDDLAQTAPTECRKNQTSSTQTTTPTTTATTTTTPPPTATTQTTTTPPPTATTAPTTTTPTTTDTTTTPTDGSGGTPPGTPGGGGGAGAGGAGAGPGAGAGGTPGQ